MPSRVTRGEWLSQDFVHRNRSAVYGYPRRLHFFGPEPSFQENLSTLAVLRRHLESLATPSEPHYEKRYPYLDRDLLEFLYGIPREQLVRPGQRRSLMRRALVNVVPEEILNRKRKAYVARNPNLSIVAGWNTLCRGKELASAQLGIVNAGEFATAVEKVRQGHDVPNGVPGNCALADHRRSGYAQTAIDRGRGTAGNHHAALRTGQHTPDLESSHRGLGKTAGRHGCR
jgi:Asparagine synthase